MSLVAKSVEYGRYHCFDFTVFHVQLSSCGTQSFRITINIFFKYIEFCAWKSIFVIIFWWKFTMNMLQLSERAKSNSHELKPMILIINQPTKRYDGYINNIKIIYLMESEGRAVFWASTDNNSSNWTKRLPICD